MYRYQFHLKHGLQICIYGDIIAKLCVQTSKGISTFIHGLSKPDSLQYQAPPI